MSTNGKEIFLKDYRTPNYWVDSLDLEFDIYDDHVISTSTARYIQNSEHELDTLDLNGQDLELVSIKVNNEEFSSDNYKVEGDILSLKNLPSEFELRIDVKIYPEKNFTGDGLYRSGDIYCTQCEAEGFRKITYFLDRPDVMTKYTTLLKAEKKRFPLLLSNGNKIEAGELEAGRHFVKWEDPHKKPAYLFAMVAGDLAVVKDTYKTTSGRDVSLEIYVDPGNEDKCDHAMRSLINSMKWDEDNFGLEYDLDIYMVVAVDSFNMGAMENKGLNIFNSSYVLAKKETATDSDFQGIEGVIGHEYFHNWTGNRVTCRDWFQLTLKEGLTVFRDQEFSSDMLSRPVKRIDDVQGLRSHQFPEDAGPLSHPIQPKSFVEINNFYTATIYEKGSEIIRMIHTLLGKAGFRKGMDLYFQRHDGQAVTTQDFVAAMADANDYNLDHFKVWYDQNGTPVLNIKTDYNEDTKQYKVEIVQNTKTNNTNYNHLYFPFHISLYSKSGDRLTIEKDGKFIINETKTELVFDNITECPIPSFNENFTAPVMVKYTYTKDELAVLMSSCEDEFNQYDSTQTLIETEIKELTNAHKLGEELKVSEVFLNSYKKLLTNHELDNSFKAYALTIPSLSEFLTKCDSYDFDHLPKAIEFLGKSIGESFEDDLLSIVHNLVAKGEFSLDAKAMGDRAFRNYALFYLSLNERPASIDLAYSQFNNATNMTDEFNALSILSRKENPYREKVISGFFDKWKDETLVVQKWLSAQATAKDSDVANIKRLEESSFFDIKVPNQLRSLIVVFAVYNPMQFHVKDGSGYKYYADKIIEVDGFNPQIAAGMCKRLNFMTKLDPERSHHLKQELTRIKQHAGLSSDTLEVVSKNLQA